MQYFATGEAASFLARQPGVRLAMSKRSDPKAQEESDQVKAARNTLAGLKIKAVNLSTQVTNEVDRIALLDFPPPAVIPSGPPAPTADAPAPAAPATPNLNLAVEALKDSGLMDEANTDIVRKESSPAKKVHALKAIASGLTGPDDVPKLEKYLNLLKAIK